MISDTILATQQMYRMLLDLSSHPGKIATFRDETINDTSYSEALIATTNTLFDNEIAFYMENEQESKVISAITGAHRTNIIAESDFVITTEASLSTAQLLQLNKGTLLSPEKSSTLMLEIESIGSGYLYRLTGPGIKHHSDLQLSISPEIIEQRTQMCEEFPMGIDLIMCDKDNHIVLIPRTTNMEVLK